MHGVDGGDRLEEGGHRIGEVAVATAADDSESELAAASGVDACFNEAASAGAADSGESECAGALSVDACSSDWQIACAPDGCEDGVAVAITAGVGGDDASAADGGETRLADSMWATDAARGALLSHLSAETAADGGTASACDRDLQPSDSASPS